MQMILQELIENYGYAMVLIGTFFEGETILIMAGFLAHQGYLKLPWVLVAAFLGTTAGDQLFFVLGHLKGMQYLERHRTWKTKSARVLHLLRKNQNRVILGFRFLYGLRTVTPFVMGASGVRPSRFLALNMIGALTWACVIGILAYLFGQTIESVLRDARRYEETILGIIICAGATLWIIRLVVWKRRKASRGSTKNKPLP